MNKHFYPVTKIEEMSLPLPCPAEFSIFQKSRIRSHGYQDRYSYPCVFASLVEFNRKTKIFEKSFKKKKTCKKQNVNLLRAKPTHIHTLLTTSFTDPKTFPNKFNFIINAGPLIFFPVIQKEVYFFLKFEYILFF